MRDVGEKERELLISSRNEPDGVSVEVRDSGPGFAPAAPERVFEAFYTTKPGGLGLGLSICRAIIEAHGGRLWATRGEPRGALFQVTVPADLAAIRDRCRLLARLRHASRLRICPLKGLPPSRSDKAGSNSRISRRVPELPGL